MVCVLSSTLCNYDLRKGDLFVLIWAMVRRVWLECFFCGCCCLSQPGPSRFPL